MRGIVRETYGPPEALQLGAVDEPVIGDHDVLVQVLAAGVDQGVWHLVTGLPRAIRLAGFGVRKPRNTVPGMDVAGVVTAVGAEVTRFRPGDEVFGSGTSTYAEYAAVPEQNLVHKPANVSFTEAAAVPISALAALQGLRKGDVQAGQRVLVIGAGGGVGSYAIQLAVAAGTQAGTGRPHVPADRRRRRDRLPARGEGPGQGRAHRLADPDGRHCGGSDDGRTSWSPPRRPRPRLPRRRTARRTPRAELLRGRAPAVWGRCGCRVGVDESSLLPGSMP